MLEKDQDKRITTIELLNNGQILRCTDEYCFQMPPTLHALIIIPQGFCDSCGNQFCFSNMFDCSKGHKICFLCRTDSLLIEKNKHSRQIPCKVDGCDGTLACIHTYVMRKNLKKNMKRL